MNEQTDKHPQQSLWDKLKVLLIIGTAILLFLVLVAFHQYYPDHPVVRWLWIILWVVGVPGLLFYNLFIMVEKRTKKKD